MDIFLFHVVLPLTISSFWRSPSVWRRCVYVNGTFSNEPRSPPPSRISDAKENPLSRLMSLFCLNPSFKIPSSSGWQSDWTMSELPHSFLYSSMILDSWLDSKISSGMVCWRGWKTGNEVTQRVNKWVKNDSKDWVHNLCFTSSIHLRYFTLFTWWFMSKSLLLG